MKKETNKKVTVSFEIETDLYFRLLQACVDRRQTIDDFVEEALKNFIAMSKTKKGKQKISETINKYKGI